MGSYLEPLSKDPLCFVSHLKAHEQEAAEGKNPLVKFLLHRTLALVIISYDPKTLEEALKGLRVLFQRSEAACGMMEEMEEGAKTQILQKLLLLLSLGEHPSLV